MTAVATRLEAALDAAIAGVHLNVMVMGPGPTSKGERPSAAARLRTDMLRRCRDYGTSVYPEHAGLIAIAARALGPDLDLCTYETHLVEECDLLIIIPSSPGSIAELGFFGMRQKLCPKMLILCESCFSSSRSYITDGPLKAAELSRARVHFIDYEPTSIAWSLVQKEIEHLRAAKTLRNLE